MLPDHESCFRALSARDARFDGLFFVGVKTTRIYCRPICPARTPGRDRCCFYAHAAAAEHDGFRPCLRCRPELAPGFAPVDACHRVARAAAGRIESGALNHGATVDELAENFGMSARQLRRIVKSEFGVTPIELAQTQRLLLAKQLIADTRLPMIDVAFSSGFDSVRRFNTSIKSRYGFTPSEMRRRGTEPDVDGCLQLSIGYRPPFAWQEFLRFLRPRLTAGVESVSGDRYARSVRIDDCSGWFEIRPHTSARMLAVRMSVTLLPVLTPLLARLRSFLDVNAQPDVISSHLRRDRRLSGIVGRHPGLRVPGTIDHLELIVRTILGQQITVKAATTLAGRLAGAYGEPVETPFADVNRMTPTADRLAGARRSRLIRLGILASRAETILAVARALANEHWAFGTSNVKETMDRLRAIRGIGNWTAQYVAMRSLQWPDAFPDSDLGIRKATDMTGAALRSAAESWSPWRSYAAMYLWQSLSDPVTGRK